MHSPNYWFLAVLLLLPAVISWLVYRILRARTTWFVPHYTRYLYWGMTTICLAVLYLHRWLFSLGWSSEWLSAPIVWLMVVVLLLPLLLVLLAVARLQARPTAAGRTTARAAGRINRRTFLARSFQLAPLAAVAGSGSGVYQAAIALPVINQYQLHLPQLPPALSGIKIAQITDLHIGPFFDMSRLDAVLAQLAAEKPDLLVITGDLIDDLRYLEETMQKIGVFSQTLPYGAYFCWGNHEYFRDMPAIRRAIERSPLKLLDNTSRLVQDGSKPFYLLGVDYPWADTNEEQLEKRQHFLARAQADVPEQAFTVLLSHHPSFIDDAFAAGIPLTLAGHTHGGQVGLFGRFIFPIGYRYMRGFYQQNNSQAYVSAGTGHWFPFRLGCPAEIAVFTLVYASDNSQAAITN